MTSVADLISTTRQHLYGMHRGEYNKLASAIDASVTTVTCTYQLKGLTRGTIIAIDDELLYVWDVNTTTYTATVARGWLGTTAAAHLINAFVEVSARFPQVAIRTALLDEIRSWPKSLYRTDTYTVSVLSSTSAINLPIDPFYDVIDVRRSSTSTDRWARVTGYDLDRFADPSFFSSGQALYFNDTFAEACDLQISFTAPFDLDYFDDGIDMQIDVGLSDGLCDIPPLGAAWRLVSTREVKRTFTESKGEERNVQEVTPGTTTQTAANLKRLRDQRLEEESTRLRALVPWRF